MEDATVEPAPAMETIYAVTPKEVCELSWLRSAWGDPQP